MDENSVGTCSELVFAPIDASFADDAPLLPSGFRIIPLDSVMVGICCLIKVAIWFLHIHCQVKINEHQCNYAFGGVSTIYASLRYQHS